MIKGDVKSIESLGLVDGPGIRSVIFLGGCKLRCKYCHNPETWQRKEPNMTAEELVKKIIRNKPYFKRNNGGVTFSGGEPILDSPFLIEVCKMLKKEGIHIAIDTAGVGNGHYEEILQYVDLVLLDIKHTKEENYLEITGQPMNEIKKFIKALNKSGVKVWIRQVMVPGVNDSEEYLKSLFDYLKKVKNIERIDFLPYHKMGDEKYIKLGINNPYTEKKAMDQDRCNQLYHKFMKMWESENGLFRN